MTLYIKLIIKLDKTDKYKLIGDSENKIITESGLFETEIGHGVLQFSVQQTRVLQEYQRHKQCTTN